MIKNNENEIDDLKKQKQELEKRIVKIEKEQIEKEQIEKEKSENQLNTLLNEINIDTKILREFHPLTILQLVKTLRKNNWKSSFGFSPKSKVKRPCELFTASIYVMLEKLINIMKKQNEKILELENQLKDNPEEYEDNSTVYTSEEELDEESDEESDEELDEELDEKLDEKIIIAKEYSKDSKNDNLCDFCKKKIPFGYIVCYASRDNRSLMYLKRIYNFKICKSCEINRISNGGNPVGFCEELI